MPQYLFRNPNTNETKELFFHMTDEKRYSEDGVEWERVFTPPQSNIDSLYNIWDQNQFSRYTENKKGRLGDLEDLSAELSMKRAEKEGYDPLKEQAYQKYKQRRGIEHPEKKKEKFKDTAEKYGFDVDFSQGDL